MHELRQIKSYPKSHLVGSNITGEIYGHFLQFICTKTIRAQAPPNIKRDIHLH